MAKCQYKSKVRPHYECDRDALPDSIDGYCICHIGHEGFWEKEENRPKHIEDFDDAIEEKEDYDFTGYYFPSDIDFAGKTFEDTAHFEEAEFRGEASFAGAKFQGWAFFKEAKFQDIAFFDEAQFQQTASFRDAEFEGGALFEEAKFHDLASFDEAKFEEDAIFERCKFKGLALFERANFSTEAWFRGAIFQGTTSFDGAEFGGRGWFVGANFKDRVSFDRAAFKGIGLFRAAEFRQIAFFNSAEFNDQARFDEAVFYGDARFENAEFTKEAHFRSKEKAAQFRGAVYFNNAKFAKTAWFDGVKFFENAQFAKVIFQDLAYFRSTEFGKDKVLEFYGAQFKEPAFFERAQFGGETIFLTSEFSKTVSFREARFAHHSDAQIAYRKAKVSHQREGNYAEAGYYYLLEMRARRKSMIEIRWSWLNRGLNSLEEKAKKTIAIMGDKLLQLQIKITRGNSVVKKLIEKPDMGIFSNKISKCNEILFRKLRQSLILIGRAGHFTIDSISGYGEQPWKVILTALTLVFGCALLYYFFFPITSSDIQITGIGWGYFKDCLYFSFVTFTTLGYGDLRPMPEVGTRVVASIEAFTGAFMMALFILCFARKWMR